MKKHFIILSLFVLSSSLALADDAIKTCNYILKMPSSSQIVPTSIRIYKNGDALIAKTTQEVNGQKQSLPEETATVASYDVRSGLTGKTPNMNQAEQLIEGTIEFLADPEIGKSFSVGLDPSAIRHAKVYVVGKFTHMGGTAIIEAKDEGGKDMGSFLTGFMPFACEKN